MEKSAYVYLMSNQHNNVLYIGVTNHLTRRVAEHKAKTNQSFTHQYNVDKLVYFETATSMYDAINREKQLKNWKRVWKDALVNQNNPNWNDLSGVIGVNDAMIQAVRQHYEEIAGQARND